MVLEIEVKPNEPYLYEFSEEGMLLHICQVVTPPPADGDKGTKRKATSSGSALDYKLEWIVESEGNEEVFESSMLAGSSYVAELYFKETERVTFSVIGPHSIKLLGYVVPERYFISKVSVGGEIVDGEKPNKTKSDDIPLDSTSNIRLELKQKTKKIFKQIGVVGLKPNVLEHSPVAETKRFTKSTSQKNKKEEELNQEDATKLETWHHESGVAEGLSITELAKLDPNGKIATPKKIVSIKYTAWMMIKKKDGFVKNGNHFDTNVEKDREPLTFPLGNKRWALVGLSMGIIDRGMRVGDKRSILIPPRLGYEDRQVGKIPPNTWLLYDVELMDVN